MRTGPRTYFEKRIDWLELYILRNGETWTDDLDLIIAYTNTWREPWQKEHNGEIRCDKMRRDMKRLVNMKRAVAIYMRASKYGRLELCLYRPQFNFGDLRTITLDISYGGEYKLPYIGARK